jgi:hypothetical protein
MGAEQVTSRRVALRTASKCTLGDGWIQCRAFEILVSTEQSLKTPPPPMLLYNNTDLPKYVMGAFLLAREKINALEHVLEEYDGPNHPSHP